MMRSQTLAAALAAMLLLGACGPATPAPNQVVSTPTNAAAQPTTPPGQATVAPAVPVPTLAPNERPTTGGRVIVGDIADAKTLNPVVVTDASSDIVTSRIFGSLLAVDPATGDVTPNLAESYDFSADGKVLTFQLRDGLKFSDGSPLTADDFKFSVMALLRSKKTTHKSNV